MNDYDPRYMGAAIALGQRGRARTTPNPSVGCIIVKDGCVIGRGTTQAGGRPHAEAVALDEAGAAARGATVYVTLEPCAHLSSRGPSCADSLIAAGVGAVVIGASDPDPRTNGAGTAKLVAAGVTVTTGIMTKAAVGSLAGYLTRMTQARPHVTLKLAVSLDGAIAMANGTSRWITGPAARAHVHLERARCDMIIVGRGTIEADVPRLDVRLAGLAQCSPRRAVLTTGFAPDGWEAIAAPGAIAHLERVDQILVEGGAGASAAFLRAGLVDRLLLYRAPVLVGGGRACLDDFGLSALDDAHGQWWLDDRRMFGGDSLEIYERR